VYKESAAGGGGGSGACPARLARMRRDTATCTPVSTEPSSLQTVLRSLGERDSISDKSIGLLSLSQRIAAQNSVVVEPENRRADFGLSCDLPSGAVHSSLLFLFCRPLGQA
jgi:hypothetical protein